MQSEMKTDKYHKKQKRKEIREKGSMGRMKKE